MWKAKDVTITFLPLFISACKYIGLASKSKWADKTNVGAVSPPLSERASNTTFPFDMAEEQGIQSEYLPLFPGLQREFMVLSISFIQTFWQTFITCIIQDRQSCLGVQKQALDERQVGTSLEASRPNSLLCNEGKGSPRGATGRQLQTLISLKKEIMANPGTPPNLTPHSPTFLAASSPSHLIFFLENCGKILRRFCFHVDVNAALEMAFNWEGEGMIPHLALPVCALPGMDTFGKGTVSSQGFPLDCF